MISRFGCLGILFDSDGVLVDSDASVEFAWSRWAVSYGLDPVHIASLVHGRRSADVVARLVAENLIGQDRAREAAHRIDDFEIEDAAAVTALPGSVRLLGGLPAGMWAVVTSANSGLARARLAAAGMPAPAVLITADDVAAGKPAPEGYLAAAAALGLQPGDCAVFEDAPSGVQAARAAGVGTVVGVGPRSVTAAVDAAVTSLDGVRWRARVLDLSGAERLD